MPQQHIGQRWKFRLGAPQQFIAVVHRSEPSAMEISLDTAAIDGLSVPHMVFCHYDKALPIHIICKFIVPLYMLSNAVDNLQHCHRGLIGHPSADVNLSDSLGCIEFIGTHCAYSTTV